MLAQAIAAGADESQLSLLRGSNIDFEGYSGAVGRTFSCMRAAGLDVLESPPANVNGVTLIEYSWGAKSGSSLSEQQAKELGDGCLARFSRWVEQVYQTQPSSVEARENTYLAVRSAILACLRKHGGTIDDHASREEAVRSALSILDTTGTDCFALSGLTIT